MFDVDPWDWWREACLLQAMASIGLALPIVSLGWVCFAKRYLRLPRPWLAGLAMSLVGLLGALVVMIPFGSLDMILWAADAI